MRGVLTLMVLRGSEASFPVNINRSHARLGTLAARLIMNRIFGASASKKPKPNLQDAIAAVCILYHLIISYRNSDRREDGLDRSQSQEARGRTNTVQRTDEQAP